MCLCLAKGVGMGTRIWKTVEKVSTIQRVKVQAAAYQAKLRAEDQT